MKLVPKYRDEGWGLIPGRVFDFERLFDGFFRSPRLLLEDSLPAVSGWAPSVDVSEKDGAYEVRAEVPGVEEKDLDISIHDDVLSICGEKKEESETKEDGYYHVERRFGSFRRDIPLPGQVDEEKVEAKCSSGVLVVRLPKVEKEKSKKIQIKGK